MIIEPIFESNFLEGSYGFRPRRSPKDAISAVRKWVTYGYSTVIDADIPSYFDTISWKEPQIKVTAQGSHKPLIHKSFTPNKTV